MVPVYTHLPDRCEEIVVLSGMGVKISWGGCQTWERGLWRLRCLQSP